MCRSMSIGPFSSLLPGPLAGRARHRARVRPPVLCLLLSSLVFATLGLGCDRNIEPYEPGEQPREPDLSRIFPGPSGGTVDGMAARDGAGAAARGAFPPSRTEGAGVAGAANDVVESGDSAAVTTAGTAPGGGADGASISGRIELPSELAAARPAGAVLFVIARRQGQAGGPPMAVLRIPDPRFPVEFEIGPGDVMIQGMTFAGPVSLSARLDADGNAMTRSGADLASGEATGLEPGAADVQLVLGRQG